MKKKQNEANSRPKSATVDIAETLRRIQSELLMYLIDEAKNGKGISRMTAITKLREWYAELPPDLPPYEIEEAKPENEKIVKMREAV